MNQLRPKELKIPEPRNTVQQTMFQVDHTFVDFYDLLFEKEINKDDNESGVKNNKNKYKYYCSYSALGLFTPVYGVDQDHIPET